MNGIIKIAGAAIITAVCAMTVKTFNNTAGRAVALSGTVIILICAVNNIQLFFSGFTDTIDLGLLGVYGTRMIKSLGVGLAVKISSDVCRDCGEDTVASGIELAGKAEIILLCLPTVTELFTLVTELMP